MLDRLGGFPAATAVGVLIVVGLGGSGGRSSKSVAAGSPTTGTWTCSGAQMTLTIPTPDGPTTWELARNA